MIRVKLMYQISKKTNNLFAIISRYDYIILKKMYEHILDEDIIRECFFFSTDGMLHNFIDEIITYCTVYSFNKGHNDNHYRIAILSLPRLIEHCWDGIGDWMA